MTETRLEKLKVEVAAVRQEDGEEWENRVAEWLRQRGFLVRKV